MLDRNTLLTLFEDTANAFVFNLDFIPDEKLNWKPAPEAKSALEIVNHLAEFLDMVSCSLRETTNSSTLATTRDEAKHRFGQAAEHYADAVRAASEDALGMKFRDDMPFTKGWMVTASMLDTIHHAGQIAYLQTLLGDNDIHFDPQKLPDWAVK